MVYLSGEGGLDASFCIVASNGTMARAHLIDGLSTEQAFKNIRRLWIGYGLKWLYTDLPGVLAVLPCIEHVHISKRIPSGRRKAFFEALAGVNGIPCSPSLSTLSLNLGSNIDPSYECGSSAGVGAVYEIQRSRTAAGCPLQRVRLMRVPGSPPDTKELCHEYNADGVLVRKESLSVIMQELKKEWAKDGPGHDYMESIRRDSNPDFD